MFNPTYDENTISGGLIGIVSAFVAGRQAVNQDDVKLWASDLRALGERGDYVFSLTQFLFLVSTPE
jgi:hypothetical protein